MPSLARRHQLSGSLIYHVYNRSNRKIPIFSTAQDFRVFLKYIGQYARKFDTKIYHWAILNNHYHLLMEIADPERMSSLMAGIAVCYTRYYHKSRRTAGYLWQGRFKSQPIEKERYMLACGRYIERNPVRAGLVMHAEGYPYSSARFFIQGHHDGLTEEDPLYEQFGADLRERQHLYRRYVEDHSSQDEALFRDMNRPVGSQSFSGQLLRKKGHLLPRRRGRARVDLFCKSLLGKE